MAGQETRRPGAPTLEEDRRPNLLAAADVSALLASMTAGSKKAAEQEKTIPMFPDHILSEATTAFIVLGVVSVLCIFFPVGLDVVSDPMKPKVGAGPDWYFLFIHGFLRYVPATLAVVAVTLGVMLLAAWPWLDRNPERAPGRRPLAMALGALLALAIAAFTYAGAVG